MPVMPGVRAPALWLSLAAIAISTVAFAAIVVSAGPRRPLTFAGSVLLPERPRSSSSAVPSLAAPATTLAPPTRTVRSVTSAPGVAAYPTGFTAPIVAAGHSPGSATANRAMAASSPAEPAASVPRSGPTNPDAPSGPAVPTPSTIGPDRQELAQSLFKALNDARRRTGLAPLLWNSGLQRCAGQHNEVMAAANRLLARVGDEPALGVREANQGVVGSYAGENLTVSEAISSTGALTAQHLMLAELPPADRDRQNLLSTVLDSIGIDVLVDPAHGRLWITQDFAKLS